MVYQRINITLPTETLQMLDQHVAEGDRSQFIHAAIQAYLSQIQKKKLRQQLKEVPLLLLLRRSLMTPCIRLKCWFIRQKAG